jgi:hypothetical protein
MEKILLQLLDDEEKVTKDIRKMCVKWKKLGITKMMIKSVLRSIEKTI